MPRLQAANIGQFDFGAPASEGVVLEFEKKAGHGGKVIMTFENPEDSVAALEVTVQVGPDQLSYADTSAANNLVAIANVTIPRKTNRTFEVLLRQIDNFMRVQAVGGTRGLLQMRSDGDLDIRQI